MDTSLWTAWDVGARRLAQAFPLAGPWWGGVALAARAEHALAHTPSWKRPDHPHDSQEMGDWARVGGDAFVDWLLMPSSAGDGAPHVVLVPPMSGHHPTLLRGQVRDLHPHAHLWMPAWKSASDVPLAAGRFDMETQALAIAALCRHAYATSGRPVHAVAVCQPVPTLLAAAARARAAGEGWMGSLTLMGGPVDPAAAPTDVSRAGEGMDTALASRVVCRTVGPGRAGWGRRVYPGRTQVHAFMAMQPWRHASAAWERAWSMASEPAPGPYEAFYDEYLAVADLPEEFYTQTLRRVFQRRDLVGGRFLLEGEPVRLSDLAGVPMAVVEGARDDVCAPGQCAALWDHVPDRGAARVPVLVPEAGHYGVFSGRAWRAHALPRLLELWSGVEGRQAP